MNILDIIFLVPILFMAYKGFQKGFVIELATLIALVLGIYFAVYFSYYAANFLNDNFDVGDKYLNIIAFILTFLGVVIAVFFVGKIIEKFINIILLGFINKLAGGVFGILKSVFLISVILWILSSFDATDGLIKQKTKQGSFLYEPIEQIAPTIVPRLEIDKIKKFDFQSIIDETKLKL